MNTVWVFWPRRYGRWSSSSGCRSCSVSRGPSSWSSRRWRIRVTVKVSTRATINTPDTTRTVLEVGHQLIDTSQVTVDVYVIYTLIWAVEIIGVCNFFADVINIDVGRSVFAFAIRIIAWTAPVAITVTGARLSTVIKLPITGRNTRVVIVTDLEALLPYHYAVGFTFVNTFSIGTLFIELVTGVRGDILYSGPQSYWYKRQAFHF